MAKFSLGDSLIEEIDQPICDEHKKWLEANSPPILKKFFKDMDENAVFSVIKHPQLWSGARIGETAIDEVDENKEPFQKVMEQAVDQAKDEAKNDENALNEIDDFVARYEIYFDVLKERALVTAIKYTCSIFNQKDIDQYEDLNALIHFLDNKRVLKLQKREDCLKAHAAITLLCDRLREKEDFYQGDNKHWLEQVEILSKRLLDIHYQRVKKQSVSEFLINSISSFSATTGMLFGLASLACLVLGFIFPPLWIVSAIFGVISLVGYISTAVSVCKIAYEGIGYGRSPSLTEIKDIVVDIAFAPLYFFGSAILGSIGFLKNISEKILDAASTIWLNIISVFITTSAVVVKKTMGVRAKKAQSSFIDYELMNTSAATSFNNIMSHLLMTENATDAVRIIQKTEEKIESSRLRMKLVSGDIEDITEHQTEEEKKLDLAIKQFSRAAHRYNHLVKSSSYSAEEYNQVYQQKYASLLHLEASCKQIPLQTETIKSVNQFAQQELIMLVEEGVAQLNNIKIRPTAFFENMGLTFAYILLPSKNVDTSKQGIVLNHALSGYHNIRLLCKEIIFHNRPEEEAIRAAYLNLERVYQSTDALLKERIECLNELNKACTTESSLKLSELINHELTNISQLIEGEHTDATVVLVHVT